MKFSNSIIVCFLFLIFMFSSQLSAQSFDETSSKITQLEFVQLGTSFTGESYSQRLNRIEMEVFGKCFNDSILARIKRIDEVIKTKQVQLTSVEPPVDDSMTYPSVTDIEQKMFKRNFENENIYRRLSRLEKTAFGNTYSSDNLYNRVERLEMSLNPQNNLFESNDYTFATSSAGQNNIYNKLTALEYNFLSKTFENDAPIKRLERLEKSIFGAVQSGTIIERSERLTSAQHNRPLSDPSAFTQNFFQNNSSNYGDSFFNDSNSNEKTLYDFIKNKFFNKASVGYQGQNQTTTKYPLLPPVTKFENFNKQYGMGSGVRILPD